MSTVENAVAAIARHIGFDDRRVRAVAKELRDAGLIPAGGPGRAPQITQADFISILIGASVKGPLRSVADNVRKYRALGREGSDVPSLPASVANHLHPAGDVLDVMARTACGEKAADVSGTHLEIVSNYAEIKLLDGQYAERYREPGAAHGNWGHSGHRAAVTIAGPAFVSAVRKVFAHA